MNTLKTLVAKHKKETIALTVASAILIFIVGYIVAPTIVYDQWIWKHYVGSLIADAEAHSVVHNGVTANEGYTLLSEITYGVILVAALYFIYKLLKRLEIQIDWHFFLALLPYILFGPISRVLEDTGFFKAPIIYFFISPLIYVQIAAYALFFLLIGFYFQKQHHKNSFVLFALVFLIIDIIYTLFWFAGYSYCAYTINPLVIYFFSFISCLITYYNFIKKKYISMNVTLFSGGLFILLPTIYLIGRWIAGYNWNTAHGMYPQVFILVMGLTSLITITVYAIAYLFGKNENMAVFMIPMNIAMIFAHMLDGLASYIGLSDPFNIGFHLYSEKHPIPDFLMNIWGPLFPLIKFLLIFFIIYVLYVYYKDYLKEKTTLVGLLIIGIIILGLAPGLRDLLRITIGV
ncbi:putative membrane protein [Thermoplasmatales archaeon SCGC AB-539-N05]|nr:putative membrane protein [Thermoplasmatales archaeon SCGC AB-539-N05]